MASKRLCESFPKDSCFDFKGQKKASKMEIFKTLELDK
jgi:hypothetical protein